MPMNMDYVYLDRTATILPKQDLEDKIKNVSRIMGIEMEGDKYILTLQDQLGVRRSSSLELKRDDFTNLLKDYRLTIQDYQKLVGKEIISVYENNHSDLRLTGLVPLI
jgi:hypothetical protein